VEPVELLEGVVQIRDKQALHRRRRIVRQRSPARQVIAALLDSKAAAPARLGASGSAYLRPLLAAGDPGRINLSEALTGISSRCPIRNGR
jgi:hypothetical protein